MMVLVGYSDLRHIESIILIQQMYLTYACRSTQKAIAMSTKDSHPPCKAIRNVPNSYAPGAHK
jgi:hypothetical protein